MNWAFAIPFMMLCFMAFIMPMLPDPYISDSDE